MYIFLKGDWLQRATGEDYPQKCASLIKRERFGHVRIEILFRGMCMPSKNVTF
jgi:hypothetical protein